MNPITTEPGGRTRRPPAQDANQSIRRASMTTGVGLLLMAALAAFGNFVAVESLVTRGDPALTAANIMASEGLFRLGIASLFVAIALDVVVAWALYRVFRPVSNGISMLAAWFRLAYAGIAMVAISQLIGALRLLGGDGDLGAFNVEQLYTQALLRINAFSDIWTAGYVLFGLHLLVLGYLAYRSGYVPKLLGVLLGVAGFGYAFDSFAAVIVSNPSIEIGMFTFVGELLLALWLLIRGRRLSR